MLQRTTAQAKISKLNKRVRIVRGGTSASKTFTIVPFLIDYAVKNPLAEISIVAETIPHLKRGALRDFLKIMDMIGMYEPENFNKSSLVYTFSNGAYIEFFSADAESKLRGARRKRLFINECNNINYEAYYQLAMRTSGLKILDFNPTSEFWVHTEILNNPAYNAQFIKSTYRDNEYCPPAAIAAIEARKDRDPNWYKVYGLGEVGSLEGLIFPNFKIIQSISPEFKRLGTGLDFGYTNDPTTAIDLYKSGETIIFDELI